MAWFSRKKKSGKGFSFLGDFGDILVDNSRATFYECDLGAFANSDACRNLFLNRFTENDMMGVMERAGLLGHLANLGFENPVVRIQKDSATVHQMRLYLSPDDPESLLVDIRLSESRFVPDREKTGGLFQEEPIQMIYTEWVSAYNPRLSFHDGRPQLPGQEKPGLGALKYLMGMLEELGSGSGRDGFMGVPEHFHNAVMYARKYLFLDPAQEGLLRAVLRDCKGYSLSDMSWAFSTSTMIDEPSGKPAEYRPSEILYPLSRRVESYFDSKWYQHSVLEYMKKHRFHIIEEEMHKKRDMILSQGGAPEA